MERKPGGKREGEKRQETSKVGHTRKKKLGGTDGEEYPGDP